MKIGLLFLFTLMLSTLTLAQPSHDWSFSLGGDGWPAEYIGDMEVDGSGNTIVAGSFVDTIDFDPGPGVFELIPSSGTDVFIAKYDISGDLVWAKSIDGTGNDHSADVVSDSQGMIYVTGRFNGTSDFDPGAGVFNLSSNGNYDGFVVKLDANGNFVWAVSVGGSSIEYGEELCVDNNDNIIVGGEFYSASVDFDPGPGTHNLSLTGNRSVYLWKLDANGTLIWANSFGSFGSNSLESIAVTGNNNVFATGAFESLVDFDPGAGSDFISSAGALDVFLWELDQNGNYLSTTTYGSTSNDFGAELSSPDGASIYLAGSFMGSVDFDPTAGVNQLSSAGINDVFIQKFNSSGVIDWTVSYGGTASDNINRMDVDDNGNVYSTGSFENTVDFDPGAGVHNVSASGGIEGFVQKLSSNGSFEWVAILDQGEPWSFIKVHNGDIFGSGTYNTVFDADPSTGQTLLNSLNLKDIYVFKWSQCNPTFSSISPSSCGNYLSPAGNIYFSSGNYTDTLTNACGSDSVITINLTVNTVDVTVTLTEPTITANLSGATYQWLDCDNNNVPISGATLQSYTATSNGNYAVIVNDGTCSDTSACYLVDNIGLDELDPMGVSVYPNPASDHLIIEVESGLIQNVTLYQLSGRIMQRFDGGQKNHIDLDLSPYESTLYLLHIETDKQTVNKRIEIVK